MKFKVKQTDDPQIRTKLRLGEVERLIRKHRILVPPPSRPTLIALCEDGTLEATGRVPTKLGWLVYEDSFWKWAQSLDAEVDGAKRS